MEHRIMPFGNQLDYWMRALEMAFPDVEEITRAAGCEPAFGSWSPEAIEEMIRALSRKLDSSGG